jgi:hypothetical protein
MSFDTDENKSIAIRPPGAYSLLLLFYLMTMAAIVVAACRMAFDNSHLTLQSFGMGAVVCAGGGSIVGSVIGFLVDRNSVGLFIGASVGICAGLVATWMALIDPTHYTNLNLLVIGGCWLIAAVAITANRFQV